MRTILILTGLMTAAGTVLAVTPEYEALRAELRAFYPDERHAPCKLAAQTNNVQTIARGIDAFAAAHPEADAFDVRRASYLEMRRSLVSELWC